MNELIVGKRSRGKKVRCEECKYFDGISKIEIHLGCKSWLVSCKKFGNVQIMGLIERDDNDIPCMTCLKHEINPLCLKYGYTKRKRKKKKKSALKKWKEEHNMTGAEIAKMLDVSLRQANRYIAGEAMPPWMALLAESLTGIPRGRFIFTPKVMEGEK